MKKKKWWTITFYFLNIEDYIGKSAYNSTIWVNDIDDRVIDLDSAYKYANMIKGDRPLWCNIRKGNHK